MSKVIRLSDDVLMELEEFHYRYMHRLIIDCDKYDSKFLCDLRDEKAKYTDSQWVAFAIRFACNHANDEPFPSSI